MFSVVHFQATNEVEVVSSAWLVEEGCCAWPPFKHTKLKKALLSAQTPDKDWEMHSIKLMGQYDTFEIAKRKCVMSEEKSSLESERSEDEKRSRKRRKQVVLSSDSDEESSSLPLPSRLKKPFYTNKGFSPSLISGPNTSHAVLHQINEPADFTSFSGGSSRAVLQQVNESADVSWYQQSPRSHASSDSLSLHTLTDHPMRIVSDEPTSTEKRLLQMLLTVQSTLTEIVSLLNNLVRKESVPVNDLEVFPNLPLQTLSSLKEFDQSLSFEETFVKAVRHLAHRGGHNIKTTTRNILQCLLTDEVAALFNWAGRGNKEEFKKLKMSNLILFAVRENINTKNAVAKEVEDYVKEWLKYAPVRIARGRSSKNLL
ncbi:uncharacterized protein LOC129220360 [Uloborus diversus]|uniref:uncharacterized protein LOC129220360 n=1 Tax=Uloborus diversus TaxID=327109 RepID=UPI00240A272F|nr:uncharacterized protein LOC129220360 [Uloborus diversus]